MIIGQRAVFYVRRVTWWGLALTVVAYAAAALVAGWPLVAVAGWGLAVAWVRGWPPRRLVVAAVWCAPMLAVSGVTYAAWRGGSWLE